MKAIEDDQVMLSTYKASRFVKPFAKEVDNWERDISRILEITEALLNVQKQWLYLEVKTIHLIVSFYFKTID
jgi:dynein heavy chain